MNEINSGILEVPVDQLTDMHIMQLSEQLITDFEKLVTDDVCIKYVELTQKQRSESVSAAAVLFKYVNLPDHIFKRQHNREMVNRAYLKLEKISLFIQDEISKKLTEEIAKKLKEKSHVTKTNS